MDQNKDKELKNVTVETYAEDMATILGNDTEGLVKKIIHGEEEHEEEKKNLSPESKKNKMFMFGSIALLVIALLTLSFFLLKNNANTVPVEKQFTPIIFTDQSRSIEVPGLKKDEIGQAVLKEVNTTTVKSGGLEGIYLTEAKKPIGLRRFILLTNFSFVPDADPLLVSDNFLMGVVKSQPNLSAIPSNGFFILLKVRHTSDVFSAMRAWENKMLSDLHGFLGINLEADTSLLFKKDFEDGIIERPHSL